MNVQSDAVDGIGTVLPEWFTKLMPSIIEWPQDATLELLMGVMLTFGGIIELAF